LQTVTHIFYLTAISLSDSITDCWTAQCPAYNINDEHAETVI